MKTNEHKITFLLLTGIFTLLGISSIYRLFGSNFGVVAGINNLPKEETVLIKNYDECIKTKDSVIMESFPAVCLTKDGKRFVQQVNKDNLKPAQN